jgi:microsomal epoxide hydrolase
MALASQRAFDNAQSKVEHQKLPDTTTISAREALGWITLEGAKMLKMQDRIGSLTPGKQADIVMVRADDLNMMPVRRDALTVAAPTPEEKRWLEELALFLKEETGYQWIQGTRPHTLGAALTDSPAGLAAWLFEKFQRWTDNRGDPRDALSMDTMLADIALYWFTGAIGSSFWPYYARMHGPWPIRDGGVGAPCGYAAFPREILRPPRSVCERAFTDIRRWTEMPRGGHFAAMEQPEALAHEIVEFFRPLRDA